MSEEMTREEVFDRMVEIAENLWRQLLFAYFVAFVALVALIWLAVSS
jgi:hypothetical protein